MTDRPMTAVQQDTLNRLNQDPRIHPNLQRMDLMLKGAVHAGGELIAANERLRARVAELERPLTYTFGVEKERDQYREALAEITGMGDPDEIHDYARSVLNRN